MNGEPEAPVQHVVMEAAPGVFGFSTEEPEDPSTAADPEADPQSP